MLQILDDGEDRCPRPYGRLQNAVVVFTSNVGSQDILEAFDQGGSADLIRGKVTEASQKASDRSS